MKDLVITFKPKLNNNPIEIKKAYLTLIVYSSFYLVISSLNEILPFSLSVVGLVSIMQLLVCAQLTFNLKNSNKTISIILILLGILIINRADEFNRIICETANLSVMLQMSTLLFFMIHYYKALFKYKYCSKVSFLRI